MAKFLELLLAAPEVKPLPSSEHFSVDGTLLRAWASHSSLERIDGFGAAAGIGAMQAVAHQLLLDPGALVAGCRQRQEQIHVV